MMHLVCLDMEGVLIPEIWKAVAEKTGIDAFLKTTRDEPSYDVLMTERLEILKREKINLSVFYEVVEDLEPLPGAVEFMEWAKSQTRVVVLSDTFEQFIHPIMRKLGFPTIFCHTLELAPDGTFENYHLRLDDQKRKAVKAFQALNFRVFAAGDSHNDETMLESADTAALYGPCDTMVEKFPQLPVLQDHKQLRKFLETEFLGEPVGKA